MADFVPNLHLPRYKCRCILNKRRTFTVVSHEAHGTVTCGIYNGEIIARCAHLHVHTIHSGKCTVPGLSRFCLESYNEPRALYEVLKRRDMDLITVTDHDSIDAAEELP